jgi:hypothetical protein
MLSRSYCQVALLILFRRLECCYNPQPLASQCNNDPQYAARIGFSDIGPSFLVAVFELKVEVDWIIQKNLLSVFWCNRMLSDVSDVVLVPIKKDLGFVREIFGQQWHGFSNLSALR